MAKKGTVAIYYFTTRGTGEGFWYADYSYLDNETITICMQPTVGARATEAQLKYHADLGLREKMHEGGETYRPTVYAIRWSLEY